MSIRSFQDFHDLNEADTWTVYYKKGSFGREVVKSGLSKQAATRLYNKLSTDIPSEYDGIEMVMEAVSDAQIKKVMKLAKDRPAPFAVVAVKGGKVVAQDIDIKTWELVLAHYREMAKAHPDAKIHVEDAEGQSVMESADMLPSYEVLIGLATVMGALDLAQAARGGDSIIVDVAKALKAELGDKLEAAGAEAKRVVSKFKNDPKVKEIIMDAEEEVSESKRSTAMKIRLFEEYFNEAKSDITPGSRVEVTGQSIGNMDKTLQGEVTRKNSNGTYEVSLDNGDMADYKADELRLIESVNDYVEEIGDLEEVIMDNGSLQITRLWDDIADELLDGRYTWDQLEDYELQSAIDQARRFIKKHKIKESVNETSPNFNQLVYISSAEYQKVKKLKNFNAADWKWDSKKDLYKNVRIEESVNEARFNYSGLMNDINKKQQDAMAARKAYTDYDGYSKTYKVGKKLDDLYAERSSIIQDMEQEAEPEGGQIADRYGKQLNDLDSKISKLEDTINEIGDRERELEKRYQAAMDALKQARLAMKSAMQNESVNEARIIIKTKGKRLAIDKEDLARLKSGKDIVGYSTKYPGQEEWILAIDKWEIEESVNEATETGLMVVPRTNVDANKIKKWIDSSDMHGEWNAREGYFLFPEEEDGFDELEMELTKELDGLGVNYHIEGIFESKKSNQMSIKKFESYFGDDQLNEAASGDLIEKMDKALKDFEETLGDLEFYWGQLSMAADKIGKAMAGGDDSKEMRQAWYRASMAQRNAAKQAMRMLK